MHPLSEIIKKRAGQNARYLVAIAGAPGSGKSTVAQTVADDIGAVVVPMDGFHLDNAVLDDRGWRARKGAPHTFDVGGFVSLVDRLRHPDAEVFVPVFDRDADLARTAARCVGAEARIILIEGNYLLLDEPGWSDLDGIFDLTVFLSVPEDELRDRLIQRWLDQGLAAAAASSRALENDIPNAQLVASRSRQADIRLDNSGTCTGS